jgi:hypothetical protein
MLYQSRCVTSTLGLSTIVGRRRLEIDAVDEMKPDLTHLELGSCSGILFFDDDRDTTNRQGTMMGRCTVQVTFH